MSPVARRQRGHTGRALAVAGAGVLLAVGLAFGIAALANQGRVDVRLGDESFRLDAEEAAERIAERGPEVYSDVAGGSRHLVVQHLGTDPEQGWFPLASRPAGVPENCNIVWDPDRSVFRLLDSGDEVTEDCDGREYPADGGDLPRYPFEVVDGVVDIDINADARPPTTTD